VVAGLQQAHGGAEEGGEHREPGAPVGAQQHQQGGTRHADDQERNAHGHPPPPADRPDVPRNCRHGLESPLKVSPLLSITLRPYEPGMLDWGR